MQKYNAMSQALEQPVGVKVGARVWVNLLKDHGTIRSVSRDGKRAVVDVNQVSLNVPVSGLNSPRPLRKKERHGGDRAPRPRPSGGGRREIDMHGLRVEEMLLRLERFLNDAILEGCEEIRVIHGHGSGALRKALHQRLKNLGLRHFRLGEIGQTPGGDGVTIVSL